MTRKKILWLCSWYPNRIKPFNGDFIKRHAEAVSIYEDVQVIYVIRDLKGAITKNILIEEFKNKQLFEKIIYYYINPTGLSIYDKYLSEKKYRKLYKGAVKNYIKSSGLPDITHVHVGMKAGVIARWLKKTKNVPYVVSEHWSGFLKEAKEKINDHPFYLRVLWKKVMGDAIGFSAVSEYLAIAVKEEFSLKDISIIPNVVDTNIFYPATAIQNNSSFIHISGMEDLKNPASIIKAFALVKNTHPSVVLTIIGSENKVLIELVKNLQLERSVHFHNEMPQQKLAKFIRQSTALILYSSYETFGCVIIEANACGIPVIVSDIPVFHETVEEDVNGIFARPNEFDSLAEKMITALETRSGFNNAAIAEKTASKYSYKVVGRKFSVWYREVLRSAHF